MTAGTALVARPGDLALAGPLGSLDAYLERVSRIPVLSREDERALAERFRAEGDLDAARQLVLSHLRFVVHIARGYSGYGLPVGVGQGIFPGGGPCGAISVYDFPITHGTGNCQGTSGSGLILHRDCLIFSGHQG